MSETIIDFLLARIAEDEEAALAADNCEAWECAESFLAWQVQTVAAHGSAGYAEKTAVTMDSEGLSDSVSPGDGAHIARWNPARVLAECRAKRRIVERATWTTRDGKRIPYELEEETLRELATVYADHREYREEWRP